ncbi:hypothetical protein Aph01nite_59270 [Acrocarpospora phusangensis]|uniref:Phage protein n=1 Tax=Acrocarpospora phusangensis TaxID=1070424 RepID=A0A919UR45_9ACTN|nr:hypothetical protein [Acrocarpospora phusangensis]GIH27617.1 hypothetical protein Aph01nite_59270 [Acrocarpospora phusangensis]
MALGDTYATVDDLKAYLSVTKDQNLDLFQEALQTASREVERHCDRQFNRVESASARVFWPKGCKVVTIDDFHSTEDFLIKTDLNASGSFNVTWPSTGYQLEPLNGVVDGEIGWPYFRIRALGKNAFPVFSDRASLQITAKWGWSTVPAPVKRATLVIASETFKLKDAPFGVSGYGEYGPVRIKNSPVAMRMLAPYRLNAVRVG